jgi:hypothetical protein
MSEQQSGNFGKTIPMWLLLILGVFAAFIAAGLYRMGAMFGVFICVASFVMLLASKVVADRR